MITSKQAAKVIYKMLAHLIAQSDWDDGNTALQIRALFTTICIICGMDADTSSCDYLLNLIYKNLSIGGATVDYGKFENFMLVLIV